MKLCNKISVLLRSQYVTNIENTYNLISIFVEYIFYYVVSFVKRCALHSKLNFSFPGMKCFFNKMNFGFNCVEIALFPNMSKSKLGFW